jgi:hypothetical protein
MGFSGRLAFMTGFGFLFAFGCGGPKGPSTPALMFYGECSVQVEAEPKDAVVSIDGIPVGKGSVKVDIPCGQKRIVVDRKGYAPHQSYPVVSKAQALQLKVKLEPFEASKDLAMSSELLVMARQGKIGVGDPSSAQSSAVAPKSADTAASGASASPQAPANFDPNDVESWR